ncbi:hypothetical protein AALC17_10960 [Oscillospiraceae bacterium 38-13]
MLNKIPDAEQMTALVGASLYKVWTELCALLDGFAGLLGIKRKPNRKPNL